MGISARGRLKLIPLTSTVDSDTDTDFMVLDTDTGTDSPTPPTTPALTATTPTPPELSTPWPRGRLSPRLIPPSSMADTDVIPHTDTDTVLDTEDTTEDTDTVFTADTDTTDTDGESKKLESTQP